MKNSMSCEDAVAFSKKWLPAWTGNNPELLTSFYAPDAYYWDGAVSEGITGRESLLVYFTKLLFRNPGWIWTQRAAVPMEGGFLNKWHAEIPVGQTVVNCIGVCTVEIKHGLITRNEVYFDKTEWIAALKFNIHR